MRSRTKPLLACLIGVALAVPALAQSGSTTVTQYPACPDPPPKLSPVEMDAAHASYKVGVEAYEKGDYNKALDNFRDAFRRDCGKVALLNFIARAYEGKGNQLEAIHALETYLQRNPKADDADTIQTRIANLKANLPPTTTATTTATVTVTATVTAPPTATTTTTAVPTVTATATATAPENGRGHTAGPWVVMGTGLAAAIAGGVLLGVGQGNVSTAHAGCPPAVNGVIDYSAPGCGKFPSGNVTSTGSTRQDLENSGTLLSNVGLIVGGVGLAAIIGGLIWHFVEPTGPKNAPSSALLTPTLGPGYAGLAFSSRF